MAVNDQAAAQDHDERRELEDAWLADNRDAEYEECVKDTIADLSYDRETISGG